MHEGSEEGCVPRERGQQPSLGEETCPPRFRGPRVSKT